MMEQRFMPDDDERQMHGSGTEGPGNVSLLVNRFVGYGLFKWIEKTKKRVDEDEEEEETLSRTELELARSIRIFHAEALLHPTYLENCYDKHHALKNNGYLALVSPMYFDFGTEMMQLIVNTFTQVGFRRQGKDFLKNGKKALLSNMPLLNSTFATCCLKNEKWKNDSMSSQRTEAMVKYILEKATNAYFGYQERLFRQNHTGRKGDHYTANTFRPHLKSLCSTTGEANKIGLQEAEENRKQSKK
jgi:hypothetical protein